MGAPLRNKDVGKASANPGQFAGTPSRPESDMSLTDLHATLQEAVDEAYERGVAEGLRRASGQSDHRANTHTGTVVEASPPHGFQTCSTCDGHGYDHIIDEANGLYSGQCAECGGAGSYERSEDTAYHCEPCNGAGWEWDTEGQVDCSTCGGKGRVDGTPAGRDTVNVPFHGEFHRARPGVYADFPYAMRMEANRSLTDAEMQRLAQLVGYKYRATVRGEALGMPDRDSDRSFVVAADTTKSASDDLGAAIEDFESGFNEFLIEGSPVRTTDRAGGGTKGTRLVDGFGDADLRVAIYYDAVDERG
jgi:hypothetical protein